MPTMHRKDRERSNSAAERRPADAPRQRTQDDIARRAYELFEQRGCEPGHDWEDWFQAERGA